MPNETDKLIESRSLCDSRGIFPVPLTLAWRLTHSFAYLLGGSTFLVGSLQYFPSYNNLVLGGWLFTIGSAGFLFADAFEWWTNNRVGCFAYKDFEASYESSVGERFGDKTTCWGRWKRAENGVNFFSSMTGSLLYLIGSILFIPSLNQIVEGTYIFIYGSAFIFLSQSWKVYRAATYNESPRDVTFRVSNLCHDWPGFFVDAFAGIGGLAYFIGSFLFLPQYDLTDEDTINAATWFTVGGACFLLSGLFILYRYYCTLNYPH